MTNTSVARIVSAAGLIGVSAIGLLMAFAPDAVAREAVISDGAEAGSRPMPPSDTAGENQVMIDLGGQQVPVLKGGLYDRFRSNPPLAVIAQERPDIDLSWFRTLEKQRKDVGFETWSPNFYYSNSSITAVYTADMDRIKALIPEKVRDRVKPISFGRGKGLIAITSYAYHYCDNDTYNELSVSIVTTKPNAPNLGALSLLLQTRNDSMWGYVLKLPVDTELARVRGVVGYNLPKWLIPIDYDGGRDRTSFTYYDENGDVDFSMMGRKLDIEEAKPAIARTNFTNLDSDGRLTHGYSDTRAIRSATSRDADDIQLALTDGPLSRFIKSLGLKKLVRYEYKPEFQLALYTPELVESE